MREKSFALFLNNILMIVAKDRVKFSDCFRIHRLQEKIKTLKKNEARSHLDNKLLIIRDKKSWSRILGGAIQKIGLRLVRSQRSQIFVAVNSELFAKITEHVGAVLLDFIVTWHYVLVEVVIVNFHFWVRLQDNFLENWSFFRFSIVLIKTLKKFTFNVKTTIFLNFPN